MSKFRELEFIRCCPRLEKKKTALPKPKTLNCPTWLEKWKRDIARARRMMLWHVPYSVINFELEILIVGRRNPRTRDHFGPQRRAIGLMGGNWNMHNYMPKCVWAASRCAQSSPNTHLIGQTREKQKKTMVLLYCVHLGFRV